MTPRAPYSNPWAKRAYILGTRIRLDLLQLRWRWLQFRRDLALRRANRAFNESRRLHHACIDSEDKIVAGLAELGRSLSHLPEGRQ